MVDFSTLVQDICMDMALLKSNAYRYEKQDGRILGRFYQVEAARFSEGTGLGLAMVKDIAKYHRGTIAAASVVGEGSKFTVKFSV